MLRSLRGARRGGLRLFRGSHLSTESGREESIRIDTSGLGKAGYASETEGSKTKKRPATPLAIELANQIKTRGPITVHEYMRQCLMHPSKGYYARPEAEKNFGERGDFVTAPDLCQLFGELLAVWLVSEWRCLGSPEKIRLIEMGPGRGVLMADVLRAARAWPSFREALQHIDLIEPSPSLRLAQQRELKAMLPEEAQKALEDDLHLQVDFSKIEWRLPDEEIDFPKLRARWHESIASIPSDDNIPSFILAQEVLDAMPAHQFVKTESGDWREQLVDVDDDPENENHFRFVIAPTATPASHALIHASAINEQNSLSEQASPIHTDKNTRTTIAEVSPSALAIVDDAARRISTNGGGALFIDYGRHSCLGDSLRAFYRHHQPFPLRDPGLVDLTIDVDFQACGRQAALVEGAAVYGGLEQGEFFGRMGIVERLQAILKNDSLSDTDIDRLITACEHLCHPDHMGARFKVLSIVKGDQEDRNPPAGFLQQDRVSRPASTRDIIAP